MKSSEHPPPVSLSLVALKASGGRRLAGFIVLALLLALCPVQGSVIDDAYLEIYGKIEAADALEAKGNTSQAHAKYIEAKKAMDKFQKENPQWNTRIVSYRQSYLTDKIAVTTPRKALPASTATNTDSTASSAAASTQPPAKIKLLSNGAEPRVAFRLRPGVGNKQTLNLNVKLKATMEMGGQMQPNKEIPPADIVIASEVKSVAEDGAFTVELTPKDLKIADTNAMAALKKEMGEGKMDDSRLILEFTDRGAPKRIKASSTNPTLASKGELDEVLSNITPPLPEEAVGVGAKWQFRSSDKTASDLMGININLEADQTVLVEVLSITGDEMTVSLKLNHTVTLKTANSDQMPPGMPNSAKLQATGSLRATFNATHALPVSATFTENVTATVSSGAQEPPMIIKASLTASANSK